MRLLTGFDVEVASWVANLIPHADTFPRSVSIGVLKGEDLVAGVVFHDYRPEFAHIEVSMAATDPRWATRSTIGTILSYPFLQLQCQRITAVTPRKSLQPRRFLEGIGFKREGVLRLGFGTDNAIIYGLLRSEWEAGKYCPVRPVDGKAEFKSSRPRRSSSPGQRSRRGKHGDRSTAAEAKHDWHLWA